MANGDLKAEAAKGVFDWAKGQPYQNVMATLLTVAVIAGFWRGGPYVVSEIKSMLATQEDKHAEAIKTVTNQYEKSEERHERWLQRLTDRLGDGKAKVATTETEENGT